MDIGFLTTLFEINIYGDITLFDVMVFVIIVLLSLITARMAITYLRRFLSDKIPKDLLNVVEKITYYGIIIIAVISSLTQFGINLSGLLVAGGFAGLIIGFASQSVVSNFVSGLFLIFERPVKIGDPVNVGDVTGIVEDINILSTVVRTFDGIYVRIPNEKVFTSNIVNYVANTARRFEYVVGIRYADDAEKAIEVIKQVVDAHPFVLKNPPAAIFVDKLADSSVNIAVRVWAPAEIWFEVKMDLLWKIKKAIEDEGIEIPFPQRVVWFANKLQKEV
jgi:small-conductance mechanosensitive channel